MSADPYRISDEARVEIARGRVRLWSLVLEEMRDLEAAGIRGVEPRDGIHILPIVERPLWVRPDEGPEVLAEMAAQGLVVGRAGRYYVAEARP